MHREEVACKPVSLCLMPGRIRTVDVYLDYERTIDAIFDAFQSDLRDAQRYNIYLLLVPFIEGLPVPSPLPSLLTPEGWRREIQGYVNRRQDILVYIVLDYDLDTYAQPGSTPSPSWYKPFDPKRTPVHGNLREPRSDVTPETRLEEFQEFIEWTKHSLPPTGTRILDGPYTKEPEPC